MQLDRRNGEVARCYNARRWKTTTILIPLWPPYLAVNERVDRSITLHAAGHAVVAHKLGARARSRNKLLAHGFDTADLKEVKALLRELGS
jgi:hypothetical protein